MSIENTEFRPKIVAFCCNWCSYAGADLAGSSRLVYPADVKIIRVPCSCRVNPMFILRAFEKGADVIITGDMKYHNMIDMTELGICVIDAGHYPTEICVMDIFEDILKDTDIEIIKSENKDIFKLV